MTIKRIVKMTDWQSKWQVPGYTLLSSSFMGEGYDEVCIKRFGKGLPHEFFIYKDQVIVCYESGKENDDFGALIAKRIVNDKKFIFSLIKELKNRTVNFRKFMVREGKIDSVRSLEKFREMHTEYLPAFISVTRSANFISGKNKEKILNDLGKIRLFTESMYIETDYFLKKSLAKIAKKEKIKPLDLAKLHYKELHNYFKSGILPSRSDLGKRVGLFSYGGNFQFFDSRTVAAFEKAVAERHKFKKGYAKGQSAFPGLAKGIIRIVVNPAAVKRFNKGDILVTGMTRPEFVPLMKKAGAIVTDAGGILSHAAIVARELKKPCVIGTKVATQVFKDGDLVAVDAEKGIVRKLG